MPVISFFVNENLVQGLPSGPTAKILAGISDVDNNDVPEKQIKLPYLIDPKVSWINYNCWIEVSLDAGMALHKPLPQRASAPDTIASVYISDPDQGKSKAGVNTKSVGNYTDIIQRMATSTYRFILKGYARRLSYQIPIPGMKTVAGVPVAPDARQWTSGNVLIGNYNGVPLWYAEWELWYLVALPPKQQQVPPANLAQHITAEDQLPAKGINVPVSQPDDMAVPAIPNQGGKGFFTR